ncbi:hypothetical protein VCUG_01075 [Vavraia culicis subsp. floridensis]|uniref:V-SNARE coiled-coil homology domain-containing protein n=1 Tax=Vavraia culicis (isolate floridensis) TaxID=948595 RepID=L2GUY2_VAVCU|nr:uncharacterized protein VCUG_01075 [Vavraia culicis subsp. floridensis]ELA47424.1 hypothetical protein VCUG_01075 [Vavraia culicis subsp. floridensis]
MAILYLQLCDKKNRSILTNIYSRLGKKAIENDSVYNELRKIITAMPEDKQLFKYDSSNNQYVFFLQLSTLYVYASIVDDVTAPKDITAFYNMLTKDLEENGRETGFEKRVAELMNTFNSERSNDEIQKEVLKARDVCAKSLNTLVNRGEELDKLNVLADELSTKVSKFQSESRRMFMENRLRQYFVYVLIVVIIFIIYYIIFK